MNIGIRDRILIEKAFFLWQEMERLNQQGVLKAASEMAYTYSYTHKVDLGQGRTRILHLNFKLNPETNELELAGETVSDV